MIFIIFFAIQGKFWVIDFVKRKVSIETHASKLKFYSNQFGIWTGFFCCNFWTFESLFFANIEIFRIFYIFWRCFKHQKIRNFGNFKKSLWVLMKIQKIKRNWKIIKENLKKKLKFQKIRKNQKSSNKASGKSLENSPKSAKKITKITKILKIFPNNFNKNRYTNHHYFKNFAKNQKNIFPTRQANFPHNFHSQFFRIFFLKIIVNVWRWRTKNNNIWWVFLLCDTFFFSLQ